MSLRAKILTAAILPFVVFFILGIFRIQQVIEKYESALHNNYEVKAKGAADNITQLITQLDTAVGVLSESFEISNALQRADNNVLFDISNRFIGSIDTVIFADINGIVVARAPDEYRFGDDISSRKYFETTLANGSYLGWLIIDGIDTIMVSKPIKKYDDVYVGVVCAGFSLSKELLSSFVDDPDLLIEFIHNNRRISSSDRKETIVYSKSLKGILKNTQKPLIDVVLHFEEDKYFSELLLIKKSQYWSSIPIVLFMIILIIIILNRQLKPHSMIVEHILNYASNKTNADELKKNLVSINHTSASDSAKTSYALIQMVDVIEKNFKRIEQYNQAIKAEIKIRKKAEEELRIMAYHDPLTGLLNRKSFEEMLENNLNQSQRRKDYHIWAIMYLDLDKFKQINDTFGHEIGDEILKIATKRISSCLRKTDFLFRIGGDEFTIILNNLKSDEDALSIKEKICVTINRDATIKGERVQFGVSVGLGFYPKDGKEPGTLIKKADLSMYADKDSKKNQANSSL